jgi:two-component system sensor histidine kinase TctE
VVADWLQKAWAKQIDLGFEEPGVRVMTSGNAIMLAEMLNNLLDNAIRYSRDGGRVTVRVDANGSPSVAVSDDGPVIPIDERQRVFERFHRLLGAHADGSGLGLAIVREIAQLHDASIALTEDVDGLGNTFTVTFPEHAVSLP